MRLPLDSIVVLDRIRPADAEQVRRLAESIRQTGHRHG
jgi:hypothetical protein